MGFESVIGLEIHAQLKTKTKIFCNCSAKFGAESNTHTCPVCLGMPGTLPVLNRKVVDFAIKMALATNCNIREVNRFARKNYFYPDLPKGYQISQFELPIAEHGYVLIDINGIKKKIGLTRIHMEEDAGKLIHDQFRPVSCVDFNRTGVPLIEIVSEPDLRSAEEAGIYLRQLRSVVCYLDICDGNLEEGSFRCDANVSIRSEGSKKLGTRTELKNLNSFKHVEKAIEYEIRRQESILAECGTIIQETRLWDHAKGRSAPMRGKEDAHDYRYFPDPDLLPLVIDDKWIQSVKETLPELSDDKKARFIDQYALSLYDADVLTADKNIAEFFENCLKIFPKPKLVSNWIMGPLMEILNSEKRTLSDISVSPGDFGRLLKFIDQDIISAGIAKTVFLEMVKTGDAPGDIIDKKGLVQVTDESEIEGLVNEILNNNKKEVEAYKAGKTKLMGFFVGQVMKATSGKANPKIVNQILKKKL